MSVLVEERRRASAARGELLQLVEAEVLTPWDAVIAAAASGDRHLLRLRLEQVVSAAPGVGLTRARQVVEQVIHILGPSGGRSSAGHVTLAYVLDDQAQGKRLLAVLDAFISHGLILSGDDLAVWPGFPFSPCPVDPKEGR